MWNPSRFFGVVTLWLYATAVGVLWFLPIGAWFLAVSAWAPKNPFLWGLVPPCAIFAVEKLLRRTSWLGEQIANRIDGWVPLAFNVHVAGPGPGVKVNDEHFSIPANLLDWIDPRPLLASPELWIGIGVGLLLVFLAVQGRRYRTEA
jgi:hypothetical protein